MEKPRKYIFKDLDLSVVKFISALATVNENGTEFYLNLHLRHLGLNDFEVIQPQQKERWFYISYNGEKEVPAKDFYFGADTTRRVNTATVIGHLAFSHLGFPSLLYITEQLVPDHCKKRGTPVPTNIVLTFFHEFATEQDFDDFTVGRGMGDQLDSLISKN